ncbi:MAG: hypothetical protein AAF569_07550 [Pseudomonadota bacterium]
MPDLGMNELFGFTTLALTAWIYTSYIKGILEGKTKPHPFSWIVWTILIGITVLVMISDNAGPGVWAFIAVFFINALISVLSIKNGFENITRIDVGVFVLALVTLAIWLFLQNPLWAVLTLYVAHILAFIQTFRKSWLNPKQEPVHVFFLNFVRHALTVLALSNYSIITALIPVLLVLCNIALVLFLIWRRKDGKSLTH